MPSSQNSADHRKGLQVAIIGALLLTLDTPLLRLVDGNQWTVMFWRGIFVFLALSVWWLWRARRGKVQGTFLMGRWGLFVSLLYGLNNVFFVIALHNSPVANLLVILALTPLICALLSLVFLSDTISKSTWTAIAISFIGVAIIVEDSMGSLQFYGDFMALMATLSLATAIVFTRKSELNLTTAPALAGLMAAAVAFPFAESLSLETAQWGYMITNGILVMAIATSLLAYAPTLLSAAQVAMFFLLETVLGPFWVWLAVGEEPSKMALIGGTIVITTLLAHSIISLKKPTC